jgi:hypothetical protein
VEDESFETSLGNSLHKCIICAPCGSSPYNGLYLILLHVALTFFILQYVELHSVSQVTGCLHIHSC